MSKTFWVYLLASRKEGTLYTGLTSDVIDRAWKHKNKVHGGFTAQYDIRRLVWFSEFPDFQSAYEFEKKLKRWRREWKYALIEKENPDWRDLYPDLLKSHGFDPDATIPSSRT